MPSNRELSLSPLPERLDDGVETLGRLLGALRAESRSPEQLALLSELERTLQDMRDEHHRTLQQITRHAAGTALVASISTRFVSAGPEELDDAINDSLAAIGHFWDVDRSYLFALENGRHVSNTHEWCSEGVSPEIGNLQSVPEESIPWVMEHYRRLEPVHVPSVRDLPPEARADKEAFEAQSILSLVGVPMLSGDVMVGFFGLDAVRNPRNWSESDVFQLGMIANIFARALERQKAERLLCESDERFQLLARATQEYVYDWDLQTGRIWRNDQIFEMLGYPPDEVSDDPGWWPARIHPDDHERVVTSREEALEEGRTFWESEYRFQRKDGSWIYLLDRSYIARNSEGLPVRNIGAAVDLTRRREAEESLARSEKHLRALIENNSEIISIADRGGTIIKQNPSIERILGWGAAELVGTQWLDLVHPEDQAVFTLELDRCLSQPGIKGSVRHRCRHKEGGWQVFDSDIMDMTANPAVGGVVVNSRDVTERLALEQKLEQADRLSSLGYLAASVAHEFNNILMGIAPFAELIQRLHPHEAKVQTATRHIRESVDRGKRVSREILRFTRPAELTLQPLEIRSWLEGLKSELSSTLPATITVELELPEKPLSILADRAQLDQVFTNLAFNARDAMPNGGVFSICARLETKDAIFPFVSLPHPEAFLHFVIRDTGHGMPAETMRHIFEPLFTTKGIGGTGLGLAIVHQIVTRHGGETAVESTPGSGTSFNLFLPLADHVAEPTGIVAVKDSLTRPCRVLLVEDEDSVASGLVAVLKMEGFEPSVADRGLKAVGAIESFRPDLVLLDLGLPDIDGADVYRDIRKRWPKLPVIFSTGHGDRERIEEIVGDSQFEVLEKPYDTDTLLAAILGTACK